MLFGASSVIGAIGFTLGAGFIIIALISAGIYLGLSFGAIWLCLIGVVVAIGIFGSWAKRSAKP